MVNISQQCSEVQLSFRYVFLVYFILFCCFLFSTYIDTIPSAVRWRLLLSLHVHHTPSRSEAMNQSVRYKNKKLCYRRRIARRAVSQNLVNCRSKLYNKYTRNRSNGVRGLYDCRAGVVNKLDRRRRRVLLTTRSTCRGEIF